MRWPVESWGGRALGSGRGRGVHERRRARSSSSPPGPPRRAPCSHRGDEKEERLDMASRAQPRRLGGDQARVWKTRGPQTAGPFVVCRPISGQDTEVDFYSSSPLHGPTRIRATVQWKCGQQLR
jgi:hypothetical protein